MSAADALRAIAEQSGNPLFGFEECPAAHRAAIAPGPVLGNAGPSLGCQQVERDPYLSDERGLAVLPELAAGTRRNPRVCYQGIFRFEPTLVSAVRDLRQPEMAVMRIRVAIAWEPRTTPILLSQRLDQLTAVDESGRTVEVQGRQGAISASLESGVPFVEMEFPFALPPRRCTAHCLAPRDSGRAAPRPG